MDTDLAGMSPNLASLLILADGRLPSGGHAHSGGLEAAVAAGRVRDISDLAGFLHGRLATAGLVTAAFAAAACHRAGTGSRESTPDERSRGRGLAEASTPSAPPEQDSPLAVLDAGMDARTPSPALRRASRAQGRALLRAGRAMWPLAAVRPVMRADPHQPVALGVVAAAARLSPAQAALAAAYGLMAGSASAAVRLLGLDPYAVHAELAGLATTCDAVAVRAARFAAAPVEELPCAGAPLLDISAEAHASWEVRLFAS